LGHVPSNDSKCENQKILAEILPKFAVDAISEFHHQYCHVELFLRLIRYGYMKPNTPRKDRPLSIEELTEGMKKNMMINFQIINGNEMRKYVVTGQPGELGIVIHNEDIFLLESEWILDPMGQQSEIVHGKRDFPLVSQAMEYMKVLEILLYHFKHTGEMKDLHIPKRANLRRTDYEVLMITLKHYSQKLMKKNIYWKIDPIRQNRVKKLIEEVVEPKVKHMRMTSEFKLPPLEIFKHLTFETEEVIKHPDPTEVFRSAAIGRFETRHMASEDFDAGNREAQRSLHILEDIHEEIIQPFEDETDYEAKRQRERESEHRKYKSVGPSHFHPPSVPNQARADPSVKNLRKARAFKPRQSYRAPLLKKKIVEETTTDQGALYMSQRKHNIPTTTGNYREEIKKTIHHEHWQDRLKKTKQEEWQEVANLRMMDVLNTSAVINNFECRERIKKFPDAKSIWYKRDFRKPKEKMKYISSVYEPKTYPVIKKIHTTSKRYISEADPALQNRFNLRCLQTCLYFMGLRRSIVTLNYQQMACAISLVKAGRKIPNLKDMDGEEEEGNNLKKYRLMKADRKLLRMVLKFVIC